MWVEKNELTRERRWSTEDRLTVRMVYGDLPSTRLAGRRGLAGRLDNTILMAMAVLWLPTVYPLSVSHKSFLLFRRRKDVEYSQVLSSSKNTVTSGSCLFFFWIDISCNESDGNFGSQ